MNRSSNGDVDHEDVSDGLDHQLVELEEETETEHEEMEVTEQYLFIDIKGAIKQPAVYQMNEGDRVIDIISRAGGFTKQADETAINLAQKLQDEMVIIVPKEGESLVESVAVNTDATNQADGNKVKINEATIEELEMLNGIGPAKAQAIIAYRDEHGPFQTVEDILEVSGIGEKTLDHFKDDLIVP